MVSMDLSTRERDGRAVVALRGELDVADAASVAAALAAVAARAPEIIVDLAGLEFIDSSGLAALMLTRKQARHAQGDLLLAALDGLAFFGVSGTRPEPDFGGESALPGARMAGSRPRSI